MSNEATLNVYLHILKDNLEYRSSPTSFLADVATGKGPVPGAFLASSAGVGTLIDFTNLSTPGLAMIKNLDDTNFVELGNVVGGVFYAVDEIRAGELFPKRFGRNIDKTGIYIRANTADCEVVVEGFEA